MAWSWANKGGSGHRGDAWSMEEQPKNKRRRLSAKHQQQHEKSDGGGDDWGDDSLELTQAELESLDVMTSQVMTQEAPSASTSIGSFFVKPNIPAKSTSNRSSSSSDSSFRPTSLSSVPSSSDTSSASLSSHSSSNGFVQISKSISSGKFASLEALQSELEKKEQLICQAQDEKYRHDGEVKYLRESLHKQEMELEKMRAARDEAADHQKRMQSEREKNLQLQLEKLTSQSQFKEREYQELQQMVQTLQNKLKESERLGKISPGSGSHSQRLNEAEKAKSTSPRKVTVKPSPPSKQKQQQSNSDEDPIGSSQRQTFPTCSSFLEKTITTSPSRQPQPAESKTPSAVSQIRAVESPTANPLQRKRERRLKLNAVCPDRQGNEVLRATIQPHLDSGKPPDPGLPSLLHAMSTSLTLDSLSYSRLKDATFLSPFKPKRRINTQASINTDSTESTIQVVSQENFYLALQGLEILLSEKGKTTENPRAKFFITSEEMSDNHRHSAGRKQTVKGQAEPPFSISVRPSVTKQGAAASSSSSSQTSTSASLVRNCQISSVSFIELLNSQHQQAGTVLLLPMLCDYLHHYVDLIHSAHSKLTVKTANTTPVSSAMQGSSSVESLPLYTSSCSYDSSLDSLSSSVLQLLQDGRIYASAIERHAISALRCLNILVRLCPVVTSVIIKSSQSSTGSSTASAMGDMATCETASVKAETSSVQPSKNKLESGSDADDEKSTSSSELRIIRGINPSQPGISPPPTRHKSQELMDQSAILYLVIGLAGEDLEDGNASPEAVEESLRLITQLCYKCHEDQIPVLENIIDRGVLSSVFSQTKHPLILLQGQKLCKALTCSSDLMSKLCNKAENCPLYMMHRLCSTHRLDSSSPAVIEIYTEYISFLSTMSLQHRNGLCSLVTNPCRCSEELVVSVILATHKLFALYLKEPLKSDHLLTSLFQAILVLHSLAQGDNAFVQHHAPVQLTYVYLLSRMAAAFKPLRSEWEWHVSALEELCDVEPELNESSQDSEGEDRMDVT